MITRSGAQIAAKLGDAAEAIELLRQASAEGMARGGWWWVHVLAEFDDLRRDPAFQRLAELQIGRLYRAGTRPAVWAGERHRVRQREP